MLHEQPASTYWMGRPRARLSALELLSRLTGRAVGSATLRPTASPGTVLNADPEHGAGHGPSTGKQRGSDYRSRVSITEAVRL